MFAQDAMEPPNTLSRISAAAAVTLALASCVPTATRTTEPISTDSSSQKPASKSERVSSGLLTIYEQRCPRNQQGSRASGELDRSELVVVDALAKTDAALLRDQLMSIGLAHAQVAAPIVSGYLPVCAIAQLENCCSELRFVRESVSQHQKQ